MKYILFIAISIMLADGSYTPYIETYVRYSDKAACKDGQTAIKAVLATFKAHGGQTKVNLRCKKR
jgi:hypothetical protein